MDARQVPRVRAPLLLVLVLLGAGCLAPAGTTAPPPAWEGERTSFFHSAMTLAPAAEPNESAVRTGAFFQRWAAGTDYPTWAADPLPAHARVTAATVTLYVRAAGGPVVESGRFPDIMVYGGAGDAWTGFGSRSDLTAFLPGNVYEVEVELAMPEGGLWLAPDLGFGLMVVPVMLQQDDDADVEILVGGDKASHVRWSVEPMPVPDASPERGSATGEVVGTIYAGPAAPPTTSARTPVAVPNDAAWLLVWMNTTASVGVPDVDLGVEGPDGTLLATAGTPTPREAIRLGGASLPGPGGYQLVVTTAGAPRAQFTLEWIVGRTA